MGSKQEDRKQKQMQLYLLMAWTQSSAVDTKSKNNLFKMTNRDRFWNGSGKWSGNLSSAADVTITRIENNPFWKAWNDKDLEYHYENEVKTKPRARDEDKELVLLSRNVIEK